MISSLLVIGYAYYANNEFLAGIGIMLLIIQLSVPKHILKQLDDL